MEVEQPSVSDQREQRMQAVAKLKRAASLPRMKDGRRPPMHVDGVSEGERMNTDDERKPDVDTPPPEEKVEEPVEEEPENVELETAVSTTPTRSKRRSRSRSRSRNSKDFKGKGRGQQSPTPSPLIPGDSSQDEPAFPIMLPSIPPLMSPVPSHVAAAQHSRFLRSPTPTAQDLSMLPYPSSPPTPLPTLEALSKNLGLFRSNSAGRMLAMHKLTNGTETYEPSLSPSPTPPLPGKFRRTNTISGGERNGERSAARTNLFAALGTRSIKDADGEHGSAGEELNAPSPSPTPKRRRRRSKRSSSTANANAAAGLSDSDFISTTQNTPLVPPTPLPTNEFADLMNRARSVTPNHLYSPRNYTPSESPFPSDNGINNGLEHERPELPRRRSVVIEEEEDERQVLIQHSYLKHSNPPTPPQHSGLGSPALRGPHSFDAPSYGSTDSDTSMVGMPVYVSSRAPSRQDQFGYLNSPFALPLNEKPEIGQDEEEEEVLYPADPYRPRSSYEDNFDREISWVASPVPEIRMPIDDDEDEVEEEEEDYEDERPLSRSSNDFSPPEGIENPSPRDSSDSQNLLVESETSPELTPLYVPPSPSSVAALSQTASVTHVSDTSASPQMFPTRLSVASPVGERSPLNAEFTDVDDRQIASDFSGKRNGDSISTTTWEKVRKTFTRSNSSNGRRSRTNSIVTRERRDHTDSSVSRESGVSLNSAKTDKAETTSTFATQQNQQPLMQSQSASVSYVSLAPTPASRGGVSPVPPPLTSDLGSKYQSEKLQPFPGIKKLEEQRNRAKGLLPTSLSNPDVSALAYNEEEQLSPSTTSFNMQQSSYMGRDRSIPHQTSDSGLMAKYNIGSPLSQPSSPLPSQPEYFNIVPSPTSIQNSGTSSIKLPMTLTGVKQWLTNSKKQPGPTFPTISAPVEIRHEQNAFKKPSLSDLLKKKEGELTAEWEELGSTPTSASGSTVVGKHIHPEVKEIERNSVSPTQANFTAEYNDVDRTPRKRGPVPFDDPEFSPPPISSPATIPSPPDPVSSTTPDPSSSLSDYPAHSTSESSSSTSSNYSSGGNQGSVVIERLDETLARGSRSPMWVAAIENTPRKFSTSTPVLQVVNSNTVKDRFLFLFNDILVIAKPLLQDEDSIHTKITTDERKFTVKSVVQLRHLRFSASRLEPASKSPVSRNPLIRTFIHQFTKNPDHAISTLLSKSNSPDDPVFLGQVLFKTIELDRVQLGTYLARRTSKLVLKSYVDSFAFVGLRVDKALRVFLLSMHIPTTTTPYSALEYLLDSFAGRWYEANAGIVAYDKDLAVRLVRALVQLNELLHGAIAQEPGPTPYPRRNINCRDFVEAFRRYDVRNLVPDDVLEEAYDSVRYERLCQARIPSSVASPDLPIIIKRSLPSRVIYKAQSEPISLRIPHPDPHLCIQLYGQDLVFDPPVLTFQRSSEASFRVTGTSLGVKTMIMCRSGPNALKYSGLPLSNLLTVERAFMRNTFQIAFSNHTGAKRRYMFSIDDSVKCHFWVQSLKQGIDSCVASAASPVTSTSGGTSKFHRAMEIMAFRTLQESLMGTNGPTTVIEKALHQLNHSPRHRSTSRFPPEQPSGNGVVSNGTRLAPLHVRSKSRSQVYHRQAGKNELDLLNSAINGKEESSDAYDTSQSTRPDVPVWTGRELQLQCLQNSSIALVLSFLQVGAPDHGQLPGS